MADTEDTRDDETEIAEPEDEEDGALEMTDEESDATETAEDDSERALSENQPDEAPEPSASSWSAD